MTTEERYAKSMRHALEYVYVVAVRRGLDIGQFVAEFDVGRDPGFYQQYILTISVRDSRILVTANDIPHDWLEIGTGFIDTRFSQRIAFLLSELENEWVR
jgi:hypothetical protein